MKTTCHRYTHAKMDTRSLKERIELEEYMARNLKLLHQKLKSYNIICDQLLGMQVEVQKQPIYNTLKAHKLKELGEEGDK